MKNPWLAEFLAQRGYVLSSMMETEETQRASYRGSARALLAIPLNLLAAPLAVYLLGADSTEVLYRFTHWLPAVSHRVSSYLAMGTEVSAYAYVFAIILSPFFGVYLALTNVMEYKRLVIDTGKYKSPDRKELTATIGLTVSCAFLYWLLLFRIDITPSTPRDALDSIWQWPLFSFISFMGPMLFGAPVFAAVALYFKLTSRSEMS